MFGKFDLRDNSEECVSGKFVQLVVILDGLDSGSRSRTVTVCSAFPKWASLPWLWKGAISDERSNLLLIFIKLFPQETSHSAPNNEMIPQGLLVNNKW